MKDETADSLNDGQLLCLLSRNDRTIIVLCVLHQLVHSAPKDPVLIS